MVLTFQSIGLQGYNLGNITFKDDIIGNLILYKYFTNNLINYSH